MSTTDVDIIVSEIDIAASPEIVFGFLVDADKLSQWLCETATTDPRPGGVNRQIHRNGDRTFTMDGEFVDVVPFERVSFSWGYTEPDMMPRPRSTMVEITLEPTEQGTHVRLEHRGLSGSALNDHRGGWSELFGKRLPAAVARSMESGA
jgi:uncharacterized protein YndB with AHSA1/START domain